MEMKEILSRIDERHDALGTTDAEASRAATGSPDLIRNWRRSVRDGKRPGASTTTLAKLAVALKTNLLWLMDGIGSPDDRDLAEPRPLRKVIVAAHVQAGHWAEAWEWADDEQYEVAIPTDPALNGFRLYAAETRGPSMNRRWPEGTVVVFTNVEETGEEPIAGKRYVVERLRAGELEHTVKLLHRDAEGKFWLVPESDDPRFQAPISVEEGTGDEDEVRIVGRVWYAVTKE